MNASPDGHVSTRTKSHALTRHLACALLQTLLVVSGCVDRAPEAPPRLAVQKEEAPHPQPAAVPTNPAPAAPAEPSFSAGPKTVWDAYRKNEVGADNRYLRKRGRLLGMVHDIRKDPLNTIVVDLAATKEGAGAARSRPRERVAQLAHGGGVLSCRFGDEAAEAIGELERSMLVALDCTGRGMSLGTPQFADCALVWRQPDDVEPFAIQAAASYETCLLDKLDLGAMRASIAANKLPDGGALSPQTRKFATTVERVSADARAALAKLQREALPCDHPMLKILRGCDGATRDDGPHCSSPLFKLTWKHVHTE